MGCDIHMYAEALKETGVWEKVGPVFNDSYFRENEPLSEYNQPKTDQPYHERNYNLFAILADVRNGRGFAGTVTGDGFAIMDEPRGLPCTVSSEVKKISDQLDIDGHSHSWFLVQELLDCDWQQTTKERGYISEEEYKHYSGGQPYDGWSGGVSGAGIETITKKEYSHLVDNNIKDPRKQYYILVEWKVTYEEACYEVFFKKTIPSLLSLGTPNNVRIVFWFDN